MKRTILSSFFMLFTLSVTAQTVKKDIAYASPAADRQILDIYSPEAPKICLWSSGYTVAAGRRATSRTSA